jgi:hypothetical protein
VSAGSRREIALLLLAILFALILIGLLLLLLPPWEQAGGGEAESPPGDGVSSPVERDRDQSRGEHSFSGERRSPEGAQGVRRVPPREVVAQELMERDDLIPFEGTLGGRMGFYARENITVLNDRWVFARFEDGHVQGAMLLEYRVTPTGELAWEILAAELE